MRCVTGEVVGWVNGDDILLPGAPARVRDDAGLRKRLTASGQAQARTFSWEKMAEWTLGGTGSCPGAVSPRRTIGW